MKPAGAVLEMRMGLIAPSDFWSLSQNQIADLSNGCGPKRFGLFVPDTMWGLNVSRACDIHDFCFHIGLQFSVSNAMFLHNCASICCAGWSLVRKLRLYRCTTYYLAVNSDTGKRAFESASDGDDLKVSEYAGRAVCLTRLENLLLSESGSHSRVYAHLKDYVSKYINC